MNTGPLRALPRRQLVEEGFEAVLTRKYNPNSAPRRVFDGAAEAKLIALACGPAPAGHAKWSLRLLEEKVVELQIVESASDNTIGRTLKKNILQPHLKQQWVIAPEASAAFVANMEDVLEVYQRPRDPKRPLVCLDETSKQLIVETRGDAIQRELSAQLGIAPDDPFTITAHRRPGHAARSSAVGRATKRRAREVSFKSDGRM